MSDTLRIVTRESRLAQRQTQMVATAIQEKFPDLKIDIRTMLSDGCEARFAGDLKDHGGKGMFVKALEQEILDGKADIAIHSMKDVPTDEDMHESLIIGAVLKRGDIRDVVLCRDRKSFAGLPKGSKIGTSSPRREAQLRAMFPDLEVVTIRGNVDTRISKLESGEYDAIVLAKAGLDRLGLTSRIDDVLQPDIMCPAAAQGIVGIQCRQNDENIKEILNAINHEHTYMCLMAEREMLKVLQGDCHTAAGGHAEVTLSGENLRMIAMVAATDGQSMIWSRQKMPFGQHIELGRAVAEDLLAQGAEQLIRPKAA